MSESVLQNKFGGVNQRVLRTEALDFSVFDGCFPLNVGIENRIYGKAVLHKFSSPVQAIFQYFTPQGYGQGLFQTNSSVDFSPWLLGAYNFPLNSDGTITDPTELEISSLGTVGSGGYSSDSGALGGSGISYRYHLTFADFDITSFISNLRYFTGIFTDSNVIPIPNDQPFPSLPFLALIPIAATNEITPPANALVASQNDFSNNQILNNLSPPPNNNQIQSWNSSSTNTTGNLDVTSLLGDNVILLTLLVTANTVDVEIPISNTLTFEQIQKAPVLTINTTDYLIPATVAQSSEYGPDYFSIQTQDTAITFNSIRVYSCQRTVS